VCDHEKACEEFGEGLRRFYDLVLPIMAWILTVRRRGQRPNLRNVELKELFRFDEQLHICKRLKRNRIAYLCTVTGVTPAPGMALEIRTVLAEVRSRNPKSVIRGHFESWFFVDYIKGLFARIRTEAERQKGSAATIPAVEHKSFVPLAVVVIPPPSELDVFLAANT
jgi:hypothetical protein